ncbi:ferredoxin--NADP reductase [Terrimonas sp. NA20]|uniref:Ferredoxin--NADP reductase n=1 Tax=Terrimonas ginsenosidimutans TaxID=2908004 RepID=A0ABS9KN54_9BACT|nr:ferredoxin--NADP reductase [Terrimonas ginsenosidimutans]MCG2613758.1 ferredoxin--NADP reductase [Terrimonas ginsenosidimutans]
MADETSIYRLFTVTNVISETENAKTFEIAPADGKSAEYRAGQFITLVFKKGQRENRRSYSFSSAPALGEPMRITIKRVVNGEYSRQLLTNLKVGDTFLSSGIAGFFRLPDEWEHLQHLVFLAAGSGITPVYALLKTALHTTSLPVVLLYSNYSREDTIFYHALISLREQFPGRLKIEFLFSQSETTRRRLSKFLLNELLDQHTIPLKESVFYLCGPESYMLVAGISLITAGVPEKNIRKENFNTRQHVFKPVPPDTDPHQVKVLLKGRHFEFDVQYPDTILAAAKKRNIHLPYSCEAGNCGSCAATCVKGKTWMAYNEVLMDDEIAKGKVLTCQGFPVGGDVELEF